MKVKASILILLFIFSAAAEIQAATNEGYGEASAALGQFVDSFENLDNVSVRYEVERNATLNAMELNHTTGLSYPGFDQYLEIWINSSRIAEPLVDFPVLIKLSGSSAINNFDATHIFDEIGDSYQKIAVTNATFGDERFVEIEYWDSATETAFIWTHGSFSNDTDTLLLLHYDSDVANNTGFVDIPGSVAASNVWNAGFIGVWHLSEASEPFLDSTRYNNDAYEIGGTNLATTQIDGGRDIPGTNDGITVSMGIGYDDISIESWMDFDAVGADRGLASTWYQGGNQQGFILYFDVAPNNRMRFLIDENPANGGHALVYFGRAPPLLNTWYYYAAVRTRNDFVYGYENGVETIGDATQDIIIPDGGANITFGIDGLTRDFNGQMDEIRISNVSRNQNWINATYYSELDDFTTQANGTAGGGYVLDGYFTTTDYLSDPFANGSILVQMTNTSMPVNTAITMEFSEDNITWTLNDWQPIFGGFESVDLRDLNYSAGYHIRYNLSTTDPAITPRLYQSRLITTLGNASIITETQNVSGAWVKYNLTEFNASVGTVDAGLLSSTFFIDGIMFNVSEVVGVPGMRLSGNFTDVDEDAISLWLLIYAHYDGNLNHDFDIEFWDFESSAWIEDEHITDVLELTWFNSTVYRLRIPARFLRNGEVRIRLDHEAAGNMNHDLMIDQIQLQAFVPSAAAGEPFQFFWIVIGIALMIIGIVLARMWPEEGDP